MKKKITVLFLLLSLIASHSACSGESQSAPDTTAAVTETAAVEEIDHFPTLPDTDLDGFTLRIAIGETVKNKFVYTEEETGDVFNDALYNSLAFVSETFNANVEMIYHANDLDSVKNYATPILLAQEDVFDLLAGHEGQMWSMSLSDYFHNVREFKYMDFSQPWYPVFSNDEYEINGKQYIFSAYMSQYSISGARAVFINKGIAKDYDIEVPYQLVKDGKWTIDKLCEMAKSIYRDVNGNGKKDEADLYGMLGFKKFYGWQQAYVNCYVENDDGTIGVNYDKERLITATEKLSNLIHDSEGVFMTGTEPDHTIFTEGQSLFHTDRIIWLTSNAFRESDVDYGVLPIPKYDEAQKDYVTPTSDFPIASPVTAADTDKISFMVEALSTSGIERVIPTYFDTTLSMKYARDDETVEMLQIIRATISSDLAMINTSGGIDGLGRAMMNIISNPKKGMASYLESIDKKEQKIIEKINEFFAD